MGGMGGGEVERRRGREVERKRGGGDGEERRRGEEEREGHMWSGEETGEELRS